MPASSAPTLPQASGLSARNLFRSASPTSALAMTARSFLSAPPWSERPPRDQGVLTTRAAPSTISSRSRQVRRPPAAHLTDQVDMITRHGRENRCPRITHRIFCGFAECSAPRLVPANTRMEDEAGITTHPFEPCVQRMPDLASASPLKTRPLYVWQWSTDARRGPL